VLFCLVSTQTHPSANTACSCANSFAKYLGEGLLKSAPNFPPASLRQDLIPCHNTLGARLAALLWNQSTEDYSHKKHFPANAALWTPGVLCQWNNATRLGEVAVEDTELALPSCIFPVLPATSDPPQIFPVTYTHGLFVCLFVCLFSGEVGQLREGCATFQHVKLGLSLI